MSDPIPGVVTIGDIYRELIGMRQDVGKALTRLEVIDNRNADADRLHADHEARLRALEVWRWKFAGVITVLMVIVAFLSAYLAQALAQH